MSRYQQADPAAADELVARLHPILTRFYYALTGNARLVEDLLQECWLRIHRARHTYRPGDPVLPWVLAIARHTRVDQYRRWQRTSGRESSIDGIDRHPQADPAPPWKTASKPIPSSPPCNLCPKLSARCSSCSR
ncbi:MAG: RNA polymerase sigma factor [Bryobacterales bacterium]|nr:RNA polymerase sigma factor [Bryobacterales bacterium]